jgi:hypothetical protein
VGVLVTLRVSLWSVYGSSVCRYSVSVRLRQAIGIVDWWLSSVYGPAQDPDKPDFLIEFHNLKVACSGPWLLIGDFNLIYRADDKNNSRLDQCLMGQFCSFLNTAALKEVHLNDRLFTWSNERRHPTLERIDRAFV